MNKSTIAVGLLLCATFAYAQKGKFIKTDTIKVQQIEDINLHKTEILIRQNHYLPNLILR